MKTLKLKYVIIALVSQILFLGFLVAGIFSRIFLLLSAVFLVVYVLTDCRFLRCPDCHAYLNLNKLFYSRKHEYHCPVCGVIIKVEK